MRAVLRRGRFLLLALLVVAVILPGSALAQTQKSDPSNEDEKTSAEPQESGTKSDASALKPGDKELPPNPAKDETVTDQIIVKFKDKASTKAKDEVRSQEGLEKKKDLNLIKAEVDKVKGKSVEQAVRNLENRSDVEYATPDYRLSASGYADEPQFANLWGLNNTGQTIQGVTGISNVDVNGKEASARTQGDPNLTVAVIDSGVDFAHPDLADRAWKNPGESGSGKETNGIDDDANGYVDDVNGWDFFDGDNTVYEAGDSPHGTHVAGTIAASVNAQGVVGVAPNIKILALKFLGPDGTGFTSDSILALEYATERGIKISNNSYSYLGPPNPAQKDAINASGQLVIASAGNNAVNNDADPNNATYPASYDSTNILSVAALDNKGTLASFSNYGAKTVDISAPGVNILSTVPFDSFSSGLAWGSGTSQAAPHATGTAALMASKYPSYSPTTLISLIKSSAKTASATTGKTVTGKMPDVQAALYPTVRSTAPASNATNVAKANNVTAKFSDGMNASTINTTTFTLVKAGTTTSIPATVTYTSSTKTATLDPSVDLDPNTKYTATVKGGSTGVKNAVGDPMKAAKTWSFTTGA